MRTIIPSTAGTKRLLSPACLLVATGLLISCEKSTDQTAASNPTASASQQAAATATVQTITGNYEPGSVIRFGTGGGSERFRTSGWSATEKDATWTIGEAAKLSIPIGASNQPLTLHMRLAALSGVIKVPQPSSQSVEVTANGQKIADWDVSAPSDFSAAIPETLVKDGGPLSIELRTPKTTASGNS